ncbi:hypothetical protein RMATCC62417_00586 [Rhizopus microsporus]|nr:hypothetical protein RMATCC62417_00586 [Rhizopus microsporus]
MRPVLYPAAERLIRNKKQNKLDEQYGDNQEEGSTGASRKRKSKFMYSLTSAYMHVVLIRILSWLGSQAKDTPEQLQGKSAAKFSRRRVEGDNVPGPVCKSCGKPGHKSSRSPECEQLSFSLKELPQRDLGNYQRYTVSITLDSYFEQ